MFFHSECIHHFGDHRKGERIQTCTRCDKQFMVKLVQTRYGRRFLYVLVGTNGIEKNGRHYLEGFYLGPQGMIKARVSMGAII